MADSSDNRRELLQRSFPSTTGIARTIRLGGGKSHDKKHTWDTYMIKGKIRRLTPTECERLMSWPDGHTKIGIDEGGGHKWKYLIAKDIKCAVMGSSVKSLKY